MNTSEEWRPVVGYEGYYEVSDHGNVRSVDRVITRSDGLLRSYPGLLLKPSSWRGYPYVNLVRGGKGKTFKVHRLVALAFLGRPSEGQEVCHNDGDPSNANLGNLRWGTHADNMQDQIRHGTYRSYYREQTHCKRGHEFTPENTYVPAGRNARHCKACAYLRDKGRDSNKARTAKRKAAPQA